MKMILVLVLSWVLVVSAEVLHEDIAVTGCSETDGEFMYSLDGEELWYADFKAANGVDTQPEFGEHINFGVDTYEFAVNQEKICKLILGQVSKASKDYKLKRDPPSTPIIYPKDQVELGEKNFLICHVTGFYPAPVTMFWKKNGENVTEGITKNSPFPNMDSVFSQFSRLDFIPQQGDIYSCSVNHLTLDQPRTRMWEVQTSQPGVGPDLLCGLGVAVGLLGVAVGTFFLIKGNECS